MVIARIKCGEIEQLVKGEQVQNIDLYEAVDVESEGCNFEINESVKSITKNALYKEKAEIQTTGLTGKRSLIGVLEDGAPYVEGDDVRSMHEDIVCGIITNLAPDAYVYYTYMVQGDTDPCGFFEQTENLIDMGMMVINLSWGDKETDEDMYGRWAQWLDHLSSHNAVTFVKSAGNGLYKDEITAPGSAYNIITVGNVNGTRMDSEYSSGNYGTGCFKPDMVAPGRCGYQFSQTSFSAAYVTGTVALMLELNPALAAYPQAIKAILMAGCFEKATDAQANIRAATGSELRKWQGAGIVNIVNVLSIVKYKQYEIGYMPVSLNETEILFKEPVYGASKLNVSLAWRRDVEATGVGGWSKLTLGNRQDLDLYLYDDNVLVAESRLGNSSTEMVAYDNLDSNSIYKIKIERDSDIPEPVHYAYAWVTNTVSEDYSMRLATDVYWIKNYKTGYYLDFNNSLGNNNLIQYYFHGNENQQWILQKSNGINVLKNNWGYAYGSLGVGSTINSKSDYARVSSQPSTIKLQWDTYNKTGTYFIMKEDNGALIPYNSQTAAGTALTWKRRSSSDDFQRWYLQKINYRKGDVNCDGSISEKDLIMLNNYLRSAVSLNGIQQYLADTNNDGKVDIQDKNLLARMLSN